MIAMVYNVTFIDLCDRAGAAEATGNDLTDFIYRATAHVAQGHLRLIGRLNGRGPRLPIDPSVMATFIFFIKVDHAWCLIRKKTLELDYEAGAREAGLDFEPITNQIQDLLFCDEDVDELYGLAGSRRPPPDKPIVTPKTDPVPSRLSESKAREILESAWKEGLNRDEAIGKVRGHAEATGHRLGHHKWLRDIWADLTGRRGRGRPPASPN